MTEELETLLEVAKYLEDAGIPYMVSGSMAMNYYAQPRLTRDIDIVVDVNLDQANRIADLLEKGYFLDREVVQDAVRQRRMFNALHKNWMIKVDFVVRKEGPYREEEFKRRRMVELEGRKVWLVAPEDLLLSKLHWAKDSRSEMQLRDARNLLASVAGLDKDYLARWAAVLGVQDMLAEVRR